MHASRSAVALALGVLAATAACARAVTPPGQPHLRATRPGDHVAHPGTDYEWWTLRLLDPHSKASLTLDFSHYRQDPPAVQILLRTATGAASYPRAISGPIQATRNAIAVSGENGSVRVAISAKQLSVDASGPLISGHAEVTRIQHGPAAAGFRLGRSNAAPHKPLRATWTVPIARGRAAGTLNPGTPLALDGWLASYEHGWEGAGTGWDTYLVYKGGETWMVSGLNRGDTVTGPGAADAMWLGVLARVTRTGRLQMCHPHIHRRKWNSNDGPPYASRLQARCHGLRATFNELHDYQDIYLHESPAILGGPQPGRGWMIHRLY